MVLAHRCKLADAAVVLVGSITPAVALSSSRGSCGPSSPASCNCDAAQREWLWDSWVLMRMEVRRGASTAKGAMHGHYGHHSCWHRSWASLLAALSLPALLAASVDRGWGQNGPAAPDVTALDFHIPSQPLASALEGYARACGVEVLYESGIVEGKVAPALEGEFTPEMALQMLLSGSEVRVRYARHNAITLSADAPDDAMNLPPASALVDADLSLDTLRVSGGETADAAGLREFSAIVQLEVERALRQNGKTASGNYRIGLSLWVDASRKIRRVALVQSTGDAERDASISLALQGLTLTRAPPANAPQPVQLVISVRSL